MTLRDYFEERAREGSWGALYDRPADLGSYNFHTRRATALGLLAGAAPCARVLDAGCGTGDYFEAAERLDAAYHGFDFAPTMVAEARRRTRSAACPAHFVVADGLRLPYQDGAFGLVLAQGYIAYFADPAPALAELRRVLAPGGLLVTLDFYRPAQPLWRLLFLRYLWLSGGVAGWWLHRDATTYGYIARSLAPWHTMAGFEALLARHGFTVVTRRPYLGGGVAVHVSRAAGPR